MYSLLHSGPACCGHCKFFKAMDMTEETEVEIEDVDVEAGEYGRCVRYPPALYHPGLLNGEFPVVSAATWCGEFKRNLE